MCSEVKNTCAYMHMYIYFTHMYSICTLYNKDIHAIHVYMIIIYTLYIVCVFICRYICLCAHTHAYIGAYILLVLSSTPLFRLSAFTPFCLMTHSVVPDLLSLFPVKSTPVLANSGLCGFCCFSCDFLNFLSFFFLFLPSLCLS